MAEQDPDTVLAFKSIKWRVTAGWVIVLVLSFRYLAYPTWNAIMITQGHEPLPELPPIALADVGVLVGLPVGGAFADKMADD